MEKKKRGNAGINGSGGTVVNRKDGKWRWEKWLPKRNFYLNRICVKLHKGKVSVHNLCTLLCRFRWVIKKM